MIALGLFTAAIDLYVLGDLLGYKCSINILPTSFGISQYRFIMAYGV